MKSSSGFSLVHILSTSSSKNSPRPSVFYDFYLKSSSRHSLVHLLPTSPPKRCPDLSVFYDFYVKSSSRYSLVRILSTKVVQDYQFLQFLCQFKLSLQSCAHSVDIIFKQCKKNLHVFYDLMINYLLTIWWTYEIKL